MAIADNFNPAIFTLQIPTNYLIFQQLRIAFRTSDRIVKACSEKKSVKK